MRNRAGFAHRSSRSSWRSSFGRSGADPGVVLTARDAAHERFARAIAAGESLPVDVDGQTIYFVGPHPARPGHVIGSAGPTTASRMDPYSPLLIERGLRAMIGKGSRAPVVKESMARHGSSTSVQWRGPRRCCLPASRHRR